MINLLTYTIIICAILAIFHFIYDGIIAPTIRISLKNKLFSIKNELLRLEERKDLTNNERKSLKYVIASTEILIKKMNNITISEFVKVKSSLNDSSLLHKEASGKIDFITKYSCPETIKAFDQSAEIFVRALIVNSGGWLIYIIPIYVILKPFKILSKKLNKVFSISDRVDLVKEFSLTKPHRLEKFGTSASIH